RQGLAKGWSMLPREARRLLADSPPALQWHTEATIRGNHPKNQYHAPWRRSVMEPGHALGARKSHYYPVSSGRPREHIFQTVGTGHVAPASRYEYWAETQIRHITMDPPTPSQRRDFRAKVTSLANATMEVHYTEFDAFSATRTLRDIRTD